MKRMPLLALAFAVAVAPWLARADRCAELAQPSTFDAASAMRAIFCEYDDAHRGTLIPVKHTPRWSAKDAEVLATPMLATTYGQGGVTKGVLVVSRQMLEGGEPLFSHAQGAAVSIYVFRQEGGVFRFEKGKREAIGNIGSWGSAPGVALRKLGEDRYGLWFSGGFTGQGITGSSEIAYSLDDAGFPLLLRLQTSEENGGQCSEDPADGRPCFGWEASIEQVPVSGEAWDRLRVRYSGTTTDSGGKVVSRRDIACYARHPDGYQLVEDPMCARRKAR